MVLNRLTELSLQHPFRVLTLLALVSAILGVGITQIKKQTGYRTFLGDDNPDLLRFDDFVERFGGGYPVLIAYSCKETPLCESVFDPVPLEMAHELAKTIEKLPGVGAVYSTANTELMVPVEDDFDIRTLYEDDRPVEDVEDLAEIAALDPLWDRNIIARGGTIGAIVVQLNTTDNDIQSDTTLAAYEALKEYEERGFSFRLVGKSVEFVIAAENIESETMRVMPVMVILLVGVLGYLLRSAIAVVLSMLVMGMASLWSQGIMGLANIPLDAVTQNAATIVFVVAVSDAVHIIARYAEEFRSYPEDTRENRIEAIRIVVRDIGMPCLLTTLTTVVALCAFLFAGYESFVGFAVTTSFGVLAAFLFTFTALPIALSYIPATWIRSARTSASWNAFANWLSAVTTKNAKGILSTAFVLLLLCGYGSSQIFVEMDDEVLQGRTNTVTLWSHWIAEHLRAPKSLEVELILPDHTSLDDPSSIAVVEQVEDFLSNDVSRIGPAHSILAPMRRVNFFLEGQDPGAERIPHDRSAIAEIFLTLHYETVDPWLDLSRRHVRVSAESPSLSNVQADIVLAEVRRFLDQSLPEGWRYQFTGTLPMASSVNLGMLAAQMRTFMLAFAFVFACLILALRSPLMALLGMLPNVLPVIVVGGALGLSGVGFDIAMTMVGAIILGIAVDDTIHLLFQYRENLRRGAKPQDAMQASLAHVGRSLVTTSGALAIGFLGLGVLASVRTVGNFALLCSLAIMAALVADLFLLPAMLHVLPERLARRLLRVQDG